MTSKTRRGQCVIGIRAGVIHNEPQAKVSGVFTVAVSMLILVLDGSFPTVHTHVTLELFLQWLICSGLLPTRRRIAQHVCSNNFSLKTTSHLVLRVYSSSPGASLYYKRRRRTREGRRETGAMSYLEQQIHTLVLHLKKQTSSDQISGE